MKGVKAIGWGIILLAGGLSPTREASAVPYDVGANPDVNADYVTNMAWTDIRCLFRDWGQLGAPWNTGGIQLSANSYPLQDSEALTFMKGYPSGVYKLSYDGTGTVAFTGATMSNKTTAGGHTTADVSITRNATLDNMVTLKITGINTGDPVRNLKLIAPGYPADGSQMFTNEFVKRCRPFKSLRHLNWMCTNGSPLVNWTDRTPPTGFQQCTNKGVAYEYMIELSNQAGRDIWVCVPDQATDAFVTGFANLLRDKLNPSLHVYVEFSNEILERRLRPVQPHRLQGPVPRPEQQLPI